MKDQVLAKIRDVDENIKRRVLEVMHLVNKNERRLFKTIRSKVVM